MPPEASLVNQHPPFTGACMQSRLFICRMNARSQSLPPGLLQKRIACPMQSSQQPREYSTRLEAYGGLAQQSFTEQQLTLLQILLVPTTECLLTGKDRETNSTFADLAGSEDFLASHVLRIPGLTGTGSDNVRDSRGRAKQFTTVNGRTIVVKESFVYSNKGTARSFA